MKLWKCLALALMLCGAALTVLFVRDMAPTRAKQLFSWASSSPPTLPPPPPPSSFSGHNSSSSAPSSSSSRGGGRHRDVRAAEGFKSLLAEFSYMFQSFTEGELKEVIGTLLERKVTRDNLEANPSRRSKRAKKGSRPCSLQEVVVSVTELGLGYQSDEKLLFKYCRGRCFARRRNYDISLEHMKKTGILKRERRDKARHSPCCRPTLYDDDISFLDNNNKYYTVHEVSARECGCV